MYKIIYESNVELMQKFINEYYEDGWELVGSVSYSSGRLVATMKKKVEVIHVSHK